MGIVTKEDFAALATEKLPAPCISIYLPTHSSGVEVNERHDLIVFKNLLQEANRELIGRGMPSHKVEALLKPAVALLDDESFWSNLSEGLVVFVADGFFKTFTLPQPVKQEIHVNAAFHLSPLVSTVGSTEYFYLLVFSKNAAAFYKGDAFGLWPMHISGLPQGMNDVIHFEEKSARKLFRGGGTATPGSGASFHGHGSGLADDREYIIQYLTEIDQTLHTEILANERAPLVLAAVEYMVGAYRQVSSYGYIAEQAIIGNYDHENARSLFQRVRKIIAPYFKKRSKRALDNYYNQLATPRTSSMPDKIIPASFYKQISDLFVEKDAHIWGSFDAQSNKLVVHPERQRHDECLINLAVVNTLSNGGDVYVLDTERMPKKAVIAAIMRY
ncbi:hypothetical protein [Parapedobacter lycopersici]|uniref:baeRF7 domain-containing protein n=1 Tax=Parapedobacter lycopersici TaxID=1864939 RepID=UPI00333EEE8C